MDDEFVLFQNRVKGYEVEVIVMRGEVALWNRTIMAYWRGDPAARAAYAAGKLEHAYSKRAYYLRKDDHIAKILADL